MTIGSWDPKTGTANASTKLDAALLGRLLDVAENAALTSLEDALTAEDLGRTDIMQLPAETWQSALADYSDQQLLALIRFFTLAEMQLPGWQAGANSPVIAINSLLKRRGVKLEKSLLQWIRQNSSNRFLPNGPIG